MLNILGGGGGGGGVLSPLVGWVLFYFSSAIKQAKYPQDVG